MQIIGATTYKEYRKYIEKDVALDRRFQAVDIPEPSVEECKRILYGLKDKYESHHNVKITDDAITSAIMLSIRYINDRYLPDKAIDLIDEASSKMRLKNNNTIEINENNIAEIVSQNTGIPVSKISQKETQKLQSLDKIITERIIGQNEAIMSVSRAIKRGRTGLKDPNRPIGTFLFLGPTGVGKTELTKAIADILFGNEKKLIRLDMSEYMESNSISKILGAPPRIYWL